MPRTCFFIALLLISGCAGFPCTDRGAERRNAITEKDEELARQAEEIKSLRSQLALKEEEIKAKDAAIQEMKAKLQNFGVF